MHSKQAFSLIEVLVVTAMIALLAALLLPALSRAKESGRRAACVSNLRQLDLALRSFADDNEGSYPARSASEHWPRQLQGYFHDLRLLVCPSDSDLAQTSSAVTADEAPRSYVLNGFGNPSITSFDQESWHGFLTGPLRGTIRESAIETPDETILFGEKLTESALYTADLHQEAGNFLDVIEQARHNARKDKYGRKSGGSNYAFADGGVRYLPSGKSICPVNLWGINSYWRTNYAVCVR